MNRLGMLVDLSHVSPDTMKDALRRRAPVIFSHSSARASATCRATCPDDVLALLPKNGGVVMVTFVPGFISQAVADWSIAEAAQQQRLRAIPQQHRLRQRRARALAVRAPGAARHLQQVADHIDHIRKVAGIDHIGLGGDFDGITAVPRGWRTCRSTRTSPPSCCRRGYTDDEVKKVLGLNVLRAWRARNRWRRGCRRRAGRRPRPSTPSTSREPSHRDSRNAGDRRLDGGD